MATLLPRLHTFLSLSGPHLGTLYNTSGLVNMGKTQTLTHTHTHTHTHARARARRLIWARMCLQVN